MPEGDTIHRAANRMRPVLEGSVLQRIDAPHLRGPRPRPGETVEAVRAEGKHLLVDFSGGLSIETHLGMTGSWHLYRTADRWRKPRHHARLVIDVGDWVAVCFNAPTVRSAPQKRAGRADLGPDLCTESPAIDKAVRRARAFAEPDAEIADVLLDQRAAAGIGNVYKSEVLWALGVNPFTLLADVDDDRLEALYRRSSTLLLANLNTDRRATVPGGLAVYDRARRPCRRCGTPIETARQGRHARSTYWCPRCQPG